MNKTPPGASIYGGTPNSNIIIRLVMYILSRSHRLTTAYPLVQATMPYHFFPIASLIWRLGLFRTAIMAGKVMHPSRTNLL